METYPGTNIPKNQHGWRTYRVRAINESDAIYRGIQEASRYLGVGEVARIPGSDTWEVTILLLPPATPIEYVAQSPAWARCDLPVGG